MVAKHGILILFATHALSALASSIGQVSIQDSDHYLASDQMGFDAESKADSTDSRQVFLDDGIFVGTQVGATERFLGIPYALPP
jgi:carboxylesterase type B